MLIKIFKPYNPGDLRMLFPGLSIVQDYPLYDSYVYSTFEYEHPKAKLFLLNDRSGVNLESVTGICNFLRSIEYMQESKIARLEKTFQNTNVKSLPIYKEAISLKIANKMSFEFDSKYTIEKLISGTLFDRIKVCSDNGFDTSIFTILTTLNAFYNKEEQLNAYQYKNYAELFKTFNFRDFRKDFNLTGDAEIDCLSLLTYFGS